MTAAPSTDPPAVPTASPTNEQILWQQTVIIRVSVPPLLATAMLWPFRERQTVIHGPASKQHDRFNRVSAGHATLKPAPICEGEEICSEAVKKRLLRRRVAG